MAFSDYHQKYLKELPENIDSRLRAKQHELIQVVEKADIAFPNDLLRVAVLGCADKRLVKAHKTIFEEVFQRHVDILTFDISIDHLQGEEQVYEHDCREPLPYTPYNVTYSHTLLRFMEPEEQWKVLSNSYNALKDGGVAFHFMSKDGRTEPTKMMQEGFWQIPLDTFELKLQAEGIKSLRIPVMTGADLAHEETCFVLFR